MATLQIKLFGRVQVSHNNWKTEVNITRVIQGLLAYLLIQRHRTHPRDELAALFWGEQADEKARGCLNTSLWRLRCALEPSGIPHETYLTSNRFGDVGFKHTSRYWLDVAVFEEQISKILTTSFRNVDEEKVQKLKSVLQLYRGELLEGFYDDWALRERERLRTLYLNSLAYLMRYEKYHGNYENGLAYGRQILELDPLREEIHRELMRLYLDNEQRPLAIRQYKVCCEILKTDLAIEPMPETQSLYTQIISSGETGHIEPDKAAPDDLKRTLRDLQQAVQSVESIHAQLRQAVGSIEAYLKDRSRLPRV